VSSLLEAHRPLLRSLKQYKFRFDSTPGRSIDELFPLK